MSIDKIKLNRMMAEMAALGSKYGYKVTMNGGSLTPTDAKIKFVVKSLEVDATGKAMVVVTEAARQYARFDGLNIEKTFVSNGKTHRVIDYHPRKYKSPWITETSDGKTFKWPTIAIQRYLAA